MPREIQNVNQPNNDTFNYDESVFQTYYGMGGNEIADWGDVTSDNVFSRWFSPEIAEQKEFARENYMMDKANAFNEYMWNKSNEYNSPEAQMQRAKEAGINLNLAAGGIMGGGNAVAQPIQSAQGGSQMNTNATSPIGEFGNLISGIKGGIEGAQTLGKILGFGKENKAQIKSMEAAADKASKEADFTFWQTRQFRRTMNILYDQAQANLDQTNQAIQNLKKQYEVFEQEKWKYAAETNLIVEQTSETKQKTKNEWYEEKRLEFEKAFRDLYGVEITSSALNMLVQAVLSGKGETIINTISDAVAKMIKEAKLNFREHAIDILNPLDEITTKKILAGAKKIIEKMQSGKENVENTMKELRNYYDQNRTKLKGKFKTYKEFVKAVYKRI